MSRGPEECGRPGAAGVAEWVPAYKYSHILKLYRYCQKRHAKMVFFAFSEWIWSVMEGRKEHVGKSTTSCEAQTGLNYFFCHR